MPSKHRPAVGHVTGFLLEDAGWVLSRVIELDVQANAFGDGLNGTLLYVFKHVLAAPTPTARLSPSDLLVPPLIVSEEPWNSGWAVRLLNRPLRSEEMLQQHCFVSTVFTTPRYFDQHAHELPYRIEPCGNLSLCTGFGLEWTIREALGLPRPNEPWRPGSVPRW